MSLQLHPLYECCVCRMGAPFATHTEIQWNSMVNCHLWTTTVAPLLPPHHPQPTAMDKHKNIYSFLLSCCCCCWNSVFSHMINIPQNAKIICWPMAVMTERDACNDNFLGKRIVILGCVRLFRCPKSLSSARNPMAGVPPRPIARTTNCIRPFADPIFFVSLFLLSLRISFSALSFYAFIISPITHTLYDCVKEYCWRLRDSDTHTRTRDKDELTFSSC